MCDSEAEKILFILNKQEREYRLLIPVYIFLAIVLWILPILLIVYLYFCIVDNEFLRIGFCIAWTAYYFLSLFKYFVKYFFPLDREDLLNLMDLAKDSPDAKQELLERLNRLYEINNQANRGWRGLILRLIGVNLPDKRTEFTQRILLTRKISGSVMKK
ncbi:hypothetical protein C1J46_RS22675 [Escherichia coli]|nr:hypothetical protein [Escherichia coli]